MAAMVRHACSKPSSDPAYSARWSGVSGAPHCRRGCVCPNCGTRLHAESGSHYYPRCDDYVRPHGAYHEAGN